MGMQDEFEKAVVEDLDGSSWFGTVTFVSALAMPPDLGIPLRTSCSAGRSAGLDSFVVSFAQTKAGDYYRNWNREGNFSLLKSGSLAGAVTDAPGVLSKISSRRVGLGSLRSIMIVYSL